MEFIEDVEKINWFSGYFLRLLFGCITGSKILLIV